MCFDLIYFNFFKIKTQNIKIYYSGIGGIPIYFSRKINKIYEKPIK